MLITWYNIIKVKTITEENFGKQMHIPIITLDSDMQFNLAAPCKHINQIPKGTDKIINQWKGGTWQS